MASLERVHPAVVRAGMALIDLPYAEAWRRLAPVARTAGVRPPTYHTARLLIKTLRTLRDDAAKLPAGADLLADVLTGRVPWRWLDRTLAGEWR